jgi:hypothetical protein
VIIEKGMGEDSGSLKLPVAPPLSGGISAKTQADYSARLQQAHGESSKCKELFFYCNSLAVHFHDWCVKDISHD